MYFKKKYKVQIKNEPLIRLMRYNLLQNNRLFSKRKTTVGFIATKKIKETLSLTNQSSNSREMSCTIDCYWYFFIKRSYEKIVD